MQPIVSFDESGNSGANLLDKDQPVFCLASVSLTDEECARVLSDTVREYKFSSLRRSAAGRQAILTILNSPLLTEERCLISGYHKRFMALAKLVDLLVEPLAYQSGINLYERGANLALSNMWYYCLPAFFGTSTVSTMLEHFTQMVRDPGGDTIGQFYDFVEKTYRRYESEDYARELALILATRSLAEEYVDIWDNNHLDPAIPAFVEHASIWTERLRTPFRIIHDATKPIAQEQLILEAMMSVTDKRVIIGYDRRKATFPIMAKEIEFADSVMCLQVQVADLVAGSAAYVLKATLHESSPADPFAMELLKTRVLSGRFRPVWPEPKFSPKDLGTTPKGGRDPIDYIGRYVSRRLGGIPQKGHRRKQ